MYKSIFAGICLFALAACGSGVDQSTGGGGGGGTAGGAIKHVEEEDGTGNGFAQNIIYDSVADTFTVDNLAFDGGNTYQRDNVVPNLGPFSVYENDNVFIDPLTGVPISQFEHKAIRAVSTSGNTGFGIVRTGAYVGYGFGGFIYQRDNGVVLPTTGQAAYSGDYGALRDFDGRGGLEYAVGTMTAAIDFEDFNAGDAVQGHVFNRRVFDTNGNDITASITTALSTSTGTTVTALPTLNFVIQAGVLQPSGEMTGSISSFVANTGGGLDEFEAGSYYAVVSGANAEEIVGIIVVEAADPRYSGVTVRETGGFILHRP